MTAAHYACSRCQGHGSTTHLQAAQILQFHSQVVWKEIRTLLCADLPILMCSTGSVPPSLKHFPVIQSWLELFCRRTFSAVNLKFNKNWLPLTSPSVSLPPYEIFTETISLAPSPKRRPTPLFIRNSLVKHPYCSVFRMKHKNSHFREDIRIS